MRILLTGATGFIGQHLLKWLLLAGMDVTLLLREWYAGDRPLPAPVAALRTQFEVVYADLRNFNLTLRAVQTARPDRVIHLAALGATAPFLPLETALRHNVHASLNLIRACCERASSERVSSAGAPFKRGGVEQLLMARTPGERSGLNMYAASKAAAWQFARMYARTNGWPLVGGMIFQAYGPGQPAQALIPAALSAARQGEDFPMTSGQQQRDWIAVEDVARGLTAAVQVNLPPGTTVELGSGQLTSALDVVNMIYDLTARGGQPRPGLLPDRPAEDMVQAANAGRTAGLIGWQAKVSLVEGLGEMVLEK